MLIRTPDWVKNAIFYQIFPDRFARSLRVKHPGGIQFKPWGSPPEEQGFQGGDLLGIVDELDYLEELGVNAIYLNPIFSSAANHRYHTFDYFQVDPLLGGNEALRELLDEAHARNIRVVLDGVFNHASRGFWPFHHILENGATSPYLDWFIIEGWPLRPYHSTKKHPPNYACWWDLPALPKLNTNNPGVRAYILDVAKYWLDFGIDGWRLDVPEEIDDDAFWQKFREVVKKANPNAYICGEIWKPAQRWLQGDQFDAVMNYVFQRAALGFFGAETIVTSEEPGGFPLKAFDAEAFAAQIEEMHTMYDWAINHVQLNLLGSHDTPRVLWTVGEDKSAVRLCTLFQMTMPGAPCIYYGDEIGMTGGQDPLCRGALPWHDRQAWDIDLLDFFKKAVALRRNHPVLRSGSFEKLYAQNGIYAFTRTLKGTHAIVVFNANKKTEIITLPIPAAWPKDLTFNAVWHQGDYTITNQTLRNVDIPPRGAVVLMAEK